MGKNGPPNSNTNIKLTHPALQRLQSLQSSIPLGEVSKSLSSISHREQTTLGACFLLQLILFMELPPTLAYFPAGRESVLRLS
jgi:hypothetical protein